jgi:Calcineurin-like phosphoesterase
MTKCRRARNAGLWIGLVVLLAGAMWQTQGGESDGPILGPYIQAVTDSSAIVCWATRGDKEGTFRHQRKVLRDLRPDSEVSYDLPGVASGSFRTAPSKFRPFTFVVYGDPRDGHDVHRAHIEQMQKIKPAFLLSVGDLVRTGSVSKLWETYFDIAGGLMRSVPHFPAIGDHEGYSQHYFDFFELPGNELWYSFDWAGCHFVALDSKVPETHRMPSNATRDEAVAWRDQLEKRWQQQMSWLRGDLYDHRNARYTFAYFHHAWRTTFESESRQDGARHIRDRFGYVFRDFNVTVFTGHDHLYHHLNDGVHFVTTGGGGVAVGQPQRTTDKTVKALGAHHFLRVDVGELGLTVSAIGPKGELLDRFEVPRKEKMQDEAE